MVYRLRLAYESLTVKLTPRGSTSWSRNTVSDGRKHGLACNSTLFQVLGMPTDAVSKVMRLPARERLALAERLWISVADERRMLVPEEHKRILRKRMADYRAGRTSAIPHHELMRRLRTS